MGNYLDKSSRSLRRREVFSICGFLHVVFSMLLQIPWSEERPAPHFDTMKAFLKLRSSRPQRHSRTRHHGPEHCPPDDGAAAAATAAAARATVAATEAAIAMAAATAAAAAIAAAMATARGGAGGRHDGGGDMAAAARAAARRSPARRSWS